ncbi:MAG: NAD(P)H-dependent glycerol-3-phosphate dehydrogenase [Candidatus Nomurabacteria bacterium]|jgi:glycerol-3-phosphate dehydrogenase (NAD(P)+)|nr:NAD(P)H-dependent glycerol-3-phosphate dehydrogenase [Candidatus Nomurabacteria bacterium]
MKIAVLGGGAWGATFAKIQTDAGGDVTVWSALPDELDRLKSEFSVEADLARAIWPAEAIFLALPTTYLREVLTKIRATGVNLAGKIFICLSKGVERETWRFGFEIAREVLPESVEIGVLSGPNLAAELARKLPAAAVLALPQIDRAKTLAGEFSNEYFKIHPGDDVAGVALGGAYKNALAIAAGAINGAGLGNDLVALLVVKGLGEMTDFAEKSGARRETFYGISGLGDLLTTAFSSESRNFGFGKILGETRDLDKARELTQHKTVEGEIAAIGLAARRSELDLPIVNLLAQTLTAKLAPDEFLKKLTRHLIS